MILCPIARAVGCKKCPIFTLCPVKGVIGDYKKEDSAPTSEHRPVPPAKRPPPMTSAAKRSGGKRRNRAKRGK